MRNIIHIKQKIRKNTIIHNNAKKWLNAFILGLWTTLFLSSCQRQDYITKTFIAQTTKKKKKVSQDAIIIPSSLEVLHHKCFRGYSEKKLRFSSIYRCFCALNLFIFLFVWYNYGVNV